MKRYKLKPLFVEYMPEFLEDGILYISLLFDTVIHKCCCGCGGEVVTPGQPNGWQLTVTENNLVSLMPSIGNWQFKCKSHYWIKSNEVIWC